RPTCRPPLSLHDALPIYREHLLPSRAQLERAEGVTQRFRERLGNRMQIYFVVPDYFETRPKACMNGLGSVFLAVAPDGTAMPCQDRKSTRLNSSHQIISY